MTITGTFLDKLAAQNAETKQQSSQQAGQTGFDNILNKVSAQGNTTGNKNDANKLIAKPEKLKKDSKTDTAANKNKLDRDRKDAESMGQNPQEVQSGNEAKNTGSAEKVEQTGDAAESNEKLDEKIIENVAETLEIPQELLAQILADLNIAPQDLADKTNINKVVMALYGLDEPVEMLNIPNVTQVLEDFEESVLQTLAEFGMEAAEETISTTLNASMAPKAEQTTVEAVDNQADPLLEVLDDFIQATVEETGDSGGGNSSQQEGQSQNLPANADNTVSTGQNPMIQASEGQAEAEHTFFFNNAEINTDNAVNITGRTEAAKAVNTQEIVNQIVDKIKVDVKADVSEIKLSLRPENLGDVSLKVSIENGIITAQFLAESQRVKEIIEANFARLEEALAEQGINVDELSVNVQQDDSQRQMQEFIEGRAKSQSRINKILNGIAEEEDGIQENTPDLSKVYKNTVNYEA